MSKKSFVTNITPLPPTVSRATAIAALHDHSAMIKLNPLVIRHNPTLPPPHASEDEFHECRWYEITDTISYLPGGIAKGEITYKGGFFDQPYGIQTHVFAPAGVDIRAKWSVRGNMPGEPREPPELGVDAPKDGLYLREDVELKCNVFLKGFVKKNLKKSHVKLVEDLMVRVNMEEEAASQRRMRSSGSNSLLSGTSSLRQDQHPHDWQQRQQQQQRPPDTAKELPTPPPPPAGSNPNQYQPYDEQRPSELDAVAQGGQNYSPATKGPWTSEQVRSPATAGPWAGESVPWPRPSPPITAEGASTFNTFPSAQQHKQTTAPSQPSSQQPPQQPTQRQKDYVAYGPQARIPKGGQHNPWKPQSGPQDAGEHAELAGGAGANAHEIGGDEVEYWRLAAEGLGASGTKG